ERIVRLEFELFEEVRKNVRADEPVFQVDASGFTGYFSERIIINGDGLVNSHTYTERILSNELSGYLEENDICYIIDNYKISDRPIVDIGGLKVKRNELLLIYGNRQDCSYSMTCFSLYKLSRENCKR
ncbi:MAG TPA: hypothetical protein PKG52_05830, partial [bacterium]|nr:hypothetical protein [bacterium]